MARSSLLCLATATLLVAFSNLPLSAAADAPPPASNSAPAEAPVELPAVNVTDSKFLPPPESWRYGQFESFEILSNASDRETRQLLRDFIIFRQALALVWRIEPREPVPLTLVLCGRENKFDDFVESASGAEPKRASVLVKDLDRVAIVIDLQRKAVTLSASEAGAGSADGDSGFATFSIDHHSQLYREYVKYLLSGAEPPLPAWLQEGLAQMVMGMEFSSNSVIFGRLSERGASMRSAASPGSASTAADEESIADVAEQSVPDLDFNQALNRQRLLPFHAFFDVRADSTVAQNVIGNTRWSKQAYAFVHLCLYGRGKRYQKAFLKFAERATHEAVTEESFKECFGMSYDKMLVELRGYIEMTDYKYEQFKIKGQGFFQPPPLELRDAADSEVGRIKGDALRAAHRLPQAHDALAAAYLRGEREPALLGALGMYESSAGNGERAQKFLEAAAKTKIIRPSVYLSWAQLLYADALAHPGTVQGKLSAEQATAILRPLFVTRGQTPHLPQVYELIADTWAHCALEPKHEHLGVLKEGVSLFPRHSELIFKSAALYLQAGYADEAAALAALGERTATTAEGKARFRAFAAKLPKAEATTAAPKTTP